MNDEMYPLVDDYTNWTFPKDVFYKQEYHTALYLHNVLSELDYLEGEEYYLNSPEPGFFLKDYNPGLLPLLDWLWERCRVSNLDIVVFGETRMGRTNGKSKLEIVVWGKVIQNRELTGYLTLWPKKPDAFAVITNVKDIEL
jgi:hypothetical protein